MFFQMRHLSSDYSCNNITHSIIVADLFMLIPWCCFSGLGRPFSYFFCCFFIICQQHTTRRSGNDFVSVKRNCIILSKSPCLQTFIGCSHGLCCILYNNRSMLFANISQFVYFSRCSIKMCNNYYFYIWI